MFDTRLKGSAQDLVMAWLFTHAALPSHMGKPRRRMSGVFERYMLCEKAEESIQQGTEGGVDEGVEEG